MALCIRSFAGSAGWRRRHRFAPTLMLIMLVLGLLGFSCIETACRPSLSRASAKADAASFVFSSASGWVHISTPTTPPSNMSLVPSSEYAQPALTRAVWTRFAMASDSGDCQYAVMVYGWPGNCFSLFLISPIWSSLSVRLASCALRASDSFSALTARCRASARCDSASAACWSANSIFRSKESASRSALSAFFFAGPAILDALCARSWAWDALSKASPALMSSELITLADKKSFLWPYRYANSSQMTAMAKNHIPIVSKRCLLLSSVELWASASITTNSAKNTMAANSRSLWARLTESSEFQSGSNARFAIVTIALLTALIARICRHTRKWGKKRNSGGVRQS